MDINPEHLVGEGVEGVSTVVSLFGDLLSKFSAEVERFSSLLDSLAAKLEGK